MVCEQGGSGGVAGDNSQVTRRVESLEKENRDLKKGQWRERKRERERFWTSKIKKIDLRKMGYREKYSVEQYINCMILMLLVTVSYLLMLRY